MFRDLYSNHIKLSSSYFKLMSFIFTTIQNIKRAIMEQNILKIFLLNILVCCIGALQISPFIIDQTVSECSIHFQASNDFETVLCSNQTSVHILQWNQADNSYQFFMGLFSNAMIPGFIQLTDDGLMIGILFDLNALQILYRQSKTDYFDTAQYIFMGVHHYHLSQNHMYMVTSETQGLLYVWDQQSNIFIESVTLSGFIDSALRVSNDGNVIVGMSKQNTIQIAYKNPSDIQFNFYVGTDYDIRYRHCEANFNFYPIIYLSGSSNQNYSFIAKFNVETQQFGMIANFTLRNQLGQAVFSDRSQFSQDFQFVAFISFTRGDGYALGKLESQTFTLITNSTHWEHLPGIQDISFQYVISQQLQYHTISYSLGTEIYFLDITDQLNCETMAGSLGPTLTGQCLCIYSYEWNADNMLCQPLQCSTKQYATGQTDSQGLCICKQGHIWNIELKICKQIQCILDPGSTGFYLASNQCQCISYYYWNLQEQKCLPHCHRPLSKGKDSQNNTRCECRNNTYWDEDIKDCKLQCRNIALSTGQNQSPQVCTCRVPSLWNQSSLSCKLQCSEIPNALSNFENGCTCINNYIWIQNELKCRRNCQADQYWDGRYLEDGSCGCLQGKNWDYVNNQCRSINCDFIYYSIGVSQDGNSCQCQDKFQWNPTLKKCVIKCGQLEDSLGLGSNLNQESCECIQKAEWSSSALRCVRMCNQYQNSTGTNANAETCNCIVGFKWNQEGFCQTQCGQNIGELEQYDQINRHCSCDIDFYWSPQNSACYRDCYYQQFSNMIDGPNPNQCQCIDKFEWNSQQNNCLISCIGFFDIQRNGNQCICETNAIFSNNAKTCIVRCTIDPLSTRSFIYDRCQCKANAVWNEQQNACECIQGFNYNQEMRYCQQPITSGSMIIMGIVGGSVVSGILVFSGIKLRQKYLKNSNNKKAQQKTANKNEQMNLPPQSQNTIAKSETI